MRSLLHQPPSTGSGGDPVEGWSRSASRVLFLCMLLLGTATAWLVLTRPVHRVEGDFLEREDRQVEDEWLGEQLRSPIAERRARAALALARIRGRAALDPLVSLFEDPAPSVRAQAAQSVGNLLDARLEGGGVPPEVAGPLESLLSDPERLVATRAVEAFGKMEWLPAAPLVTETAAPIVNAMTALVRMGADDQVGFVAEYLDSDDQDSRWAAALAARELGLVQHSVVWDRLEPLATDDNDYVRAAALRAVALGPRERAEELARAGLEHRDPKVRFEAERALATLAGQPATYELPPGEPDLLAGRAASGTPRRLLDSEDYQAVARTIGARLLMRTDLGDFEIELDFDQAPLTAARFRFLASRGALDGAEFFAVRPNGYAAVNAGLAPMRSELNATPFLRGSLGLLRQGARSAAGFFVCLTALPLADGRYVNFGRLVSGDRRLDLLAQGTVIRGIGEMP